MADEDASLLQTARGLPIAERVTHKNWKVRAEAFDDLKSTCERVFSSDDPQLSSIGTGKVVGAHQIRIYEGDGFLIDEIPDAGPLVGKGVGDANAATADKALDALHAYLQKSNEAQAAK